MPIMSKSFALRNVELRNKGPRRRPAGCCVRGRYPNGRRRLRLRALLRIAPGPQGHAQGARAYLDRANTRYRSASDGLAPLPAVFALPLLDGAGKPQIAVD